MLQPSFSEPLLCHYLCVNYRQLEICGILLGSFLILVLPLLVFAIFLLTLFCIACVNLVALSTMCSQHSVLLLLLFFCFFNSDSFLIVFYLPQSLKSIIHLPPSYLTRYHSDMQWAASEPQNMNTHRKETSVNPIEKLNSSQEVTVHVLNAYM